VTAKPLALPASSQTEFISRLVGLFRLRDWYKSKLAFAIAAALLLCPSIELSELLAIAVGISAWAGFGYAMNEIADAPTDQRAGKRNKAVGLPLSAQAFALSFAACTAITASLLWAVDIWSPLLILAGLTLAWAYSAPPLRLKERGLAGVLAGAIAQWSLPVLAIAAAQPSIWTRADVAAYALTGFFLGIRWMVIHQVEDEFRDRVSGVRTFANLGGYVQKLTLLAFLAEAVFLALTLYLTWPHSALASYALLFWVVTGFGIREGKLKLRERLLVYRDAPLAGFYFLALPLVLVLGRTLGIDHFSATAWLMPALAVVCVRTLVYHVRKKSDLDRSDTQQPAQRALPYSMDRIGLKAAQEAALQSIQTGQNPEGGFEVLVSADPNFTDAQALRAVFETAIVAGLLQPFAQRNDVAVTLQRCRSFLQVERETSGVWKYFGKGSVIAPDVDASACCLLVLSPDHADAEIVQRILSNADANGLVLTWFLDRAGEPPYRNSVDPAVNANVFILLCQRGIEAPAILKYLIEFLNSDQSSAGTTYYHSPFYFLYALSKARIRLDESAMSCIEQRVLSLIKSREELGILETALACATLAACGAPVAMREPLIRKILATQQNDGGWPAEPLATGVNRVRYYYGSRAVTSAFCLEALASAEEFGD
jgi:4-hydroxybenzoate polyprenyltransferase